jgi:hypothetical protein
MVALDRGEDIRGSTVLLYAEQGLGDTIQFARYATLLKERGAVSSSRFLRRSCSFSRALPTRCRDRRGAAPFDFHLAMLSAPFAFGTTLETFPRRPLPARRRHGPRKMADARACRAPPRIGFAWSGSRTLANDLNRSMPLATMLPLVERAGTAFSLQKDVRDSDAGTLAASRLVPASNALRDFADTAGLIEQLDLVITVDTAVAHLAGAGQACVGPAALSPDWRWLLDRSDSPWYPPRGFSARSASAIGSRHRRAGAALADLA